MSATGILTVGVGVVLAIPLVWRMLGRRFDPFEPVAVFAVAWGVMFAVRPAAMLIRGDTVFFGVDISGTLDTAVLLALVGAVAFVVGYELRIGCHAAQLLPSPPRPTDCSAVLVGAAVTALLGLVALVVFILSADRARGFQTFFEGRSVDLDRLLSGATQYLWWGSLLVVSAALIGVGVAVTTRRSIAFVLSVVLVGLGLVRTLPVGNRIFLLVLIGGMIVFAYLRLQVRPRAISLVLVAIIALSVSSAVVSLRYAESRVSITSLVSSFVSSPARVFAPLTKGADAEMAPALAGALTVVPDEFDYRFGGATFGDLVRRPVPRQLWDEKPDTPGHQIVATVWPEAREVGGFDPALTPLLYLYWDFGLAGVFVGMAAVGVGARGLFEYLLRYPRVLMVQLVFAASLMCLIPTLRQDPVSTLMEVLIVVAPIIVVFRLASRVSGRSSATTQVDGAAAPSWQSSE